MSTLTRPQLSKVVQAIKDAHQLDENGWYDVEKMALAAAEAMPSLDPKVRETLGEALECLLSEHPSCIAQVNAALAALRAMP